MSNIKQAQENNVSTPKQWLIDFEKLETHYVKGENHSVKTFIERKSAILFIQTLIEQTIKEERERVEKQIVHRIKKYTHDRSASGYDDVMGSCGETCLQCEKDEHFLNEIINLIKDDE